MEEIHMNIVMIGESGVGKTQIIRVYMEEGFQEKYVSTLDIKRHDKEITEFETRYGVTVYLHIYDIVGQNPKSIEAAHSAAMDWPRGITRIIKGQPREIRGIHGAIMVADLSREYTYEGAEISYWQKKLQEMTKRKLPRVLIINKGDLRDYGNMMKWLTKAVTTDYMKQVENFIYRECKTAVLTRTAAKERTTLKFTKYRNSIRNKIKYRDNERAFTTDMRAVLGLSQAYKQPPYNLTTFIASAKDYTEEKEDRATIDKAFRTMMWKMLPKEIRDRAAT